MRVDITLQDVLPQADEQLIHDFTPAQANVKPACTQCRHLIGKLPV